jgi:hypothetical protein
MSLECKHVTGIARYIRVHPGESVFLPVSAKIEGQSATSYDDLRNRQGFVDCIVYKAVGYFEKTSDGDVVYVQVS